MRDVYLRPVGLIPAALEPDPASECLRLAGGWLDFTAIELIERLAGGGSRSRVVSIAGFAERDWGRATLSAAGDFEALREERPRLAGLSLGRPRIMGIVNVTPDSFSDGGRLGDAAAAVAHAMRLAQEGADILDIGGESTRPGAEPVTIEEELRRVLPVIEGLAGRVEARISIDTRNAEVMRRAVAAGADIVNDVSALTHDPAAAEAVAELGVPVILMHARGEPRTMQQAPAYASVLPDVFDALGARIEHAIAAGIARRSIVVDPGIGFGKTLEHNLALIAGLSLFHGLGVPVLLGASRKAMIGALSGVSVAAERVHGSVAAALAGIAQGAQIVRVHDVAATRQAIDVWMASTSGRQMVGRG